MAVLTAEQITAWLDDPTAIRGTLVEVGVRIGADTTDSTRFLSTINYTTGTTDTAADTYHGIIPAHTFYDAIIKGGLKYTEKLDTTGGVNASLAVGDIELINPNGEYDDWLLDTWVNRPIKAYLGDPRWPRDSFFLIFNGIVSDIDSRTRGTINIKIRDKMQRLNTPLSELKYADVAPYPDASNITPYVIDPLDPLNKVADVFLPTVFGEAHNITPVLIDPANLVYISHFGPIRGLIEVRDNGVPLPSSAYVESPTTGTFRMLFQPMGLITASVKGDSLTQTWDSFAIGVTYRQTAGSIIRRLVTGYGKTLPNPVTGASTTTPSPDRFDDSVDIDQANFNAFEIANTQPVGVWSNSRESLLSVCQQLASSVGAQLSLSRSGKLRLLKLTSPPVGSPFVITQDYMVEKTLQIANKTDIQGSVNIGFTKNWTVQSDLVTNLPYEHKKLFAETYSSIIKADPDTITKYKLTTFTSQQDTLLITQLAAFTEASRRLDMYKVIHTVYRFTGISALLDLKLGDTVQLVGLRFGLTGIGDSGLGTVVSLQPDWATARVVVEVFV